MPESASEILIQRCGSGKNPVYYFDVQSRLRTMDQTEVSTEKKKYWWWRGGGGECYKI